MQKILNNFKKNKSLFISSVSLIIFIFAVIVGIFVLNGNINKKALNINASGMIEYNVKSPYPAPEISGIDSWINSNSLKISELKGKVVLIDFWTYSCINCIRTLPYVTSWYDKYKDNGLVVIGVHSPEFAFEKKRENVETAVNQYSIHYPVAQDNNLITWGNFSNQYWPASYFIDRAGNVRHTHFGEGMYAENEKVIQQLLEENGTKIDSQINQNNEKVNTRNDQSPETYLNYTRGSNFANVQEFVQDKDVNYLLKDNLTSNQWSLGGNWSVQREDSVSDSSNSVLRYKFSAKEVYLVMGGENESQVRVKVNGKLVSESNIAGDDVNKASLAVVKNAKLYKLVKSSEFLKDAVLELTFDKGVHVNAFTFGS